MNTTVTYRKASDQDIDYLLDLRTKTMNPHYVDSGLPTDKESTLQRILYQFDKAHIILLNNEPAGLLKICKNDDKNRSTTAPD